MKRIDYDICAAVVSDLSFDARVWKEVRSLTRAGYRVRLIGCSYELQHPRRSNVEGVDVLEVSLGSRGGRVSVVRAGYWMSIHLCSTVATMTLPTPIPRRRVSPTMRTRHDDREASSQVRRALHSLGSLTMQMRP